MEHLSEADLYDLAAGLLARDEAERATLHAAGCSLCAQTLRHALADLDPAQQPLVMAQQSGTQGWQASLAERLVQERSAAEKAGTAAALARPRTSQDSAWRPRLPVWLALAAALLLTVGAGALLFLHWKQEENTRLFASAYDARRPTELRVPGGHDVALFSPERGASGQGDPEPVLVMKLRAAEGLRKHPGDARWNQLAGEAALVGDDWQTAQNELAMADIKESKLPGLPFDLGMAYFERAESLKAGTDYGMAAEQFTLALAQEKPAHAVTLWNRALCFERLGLRTDALKDLEQAETLERDPAWKAALTAREAHLRSAGQAQGDPTVTPVRAYEDRVADAVMNEGRTTGLPGLRLLAQEGAAHGDAWPDAWLHMRGDAAAEHALAAAIHSNRTGDATGATAQATEALRRSSMPQQRPVALWALGELSYAAQRSGRSGPCLAAVARMRAMPELNRSSTLSVFAGTEEAICRSMAGELSQGRRICAAVVEQAEHAELRMAVVRARGMLADFETYQGLTEEAWDLSSASLVAGGSGLTAGQRYQFLFSMSQQAVALGLPHIAAILATDAAEIARATGNRQNLAYAKEIEGERLVAVGQLAQAQSSFQAADAELSALGETSATQVFRADFAVTRAPLALAQGNAAATVARLQASEKAIDGSGHLFLQSHYWTQRSHAEEAAGAWQEAEASARHATRLTEAAAAGPQDAETRKAWRRVARPAFEALVTALLREGRTAQALVAWKAFRAAAPELASVAPNSFPPPSDVALTYARLPSGYVLFVERTGQPAPEAIALAGSNEQVERLADGFRRLCGDRNSSPDSVAAMSVALFEELIEPAHLKQPKDVRIGASGILREVPFSALRARPDGPVFAPGALMEPAESTFVRRQGSAREQTEASFLPAAAMDVLSAPDALTASPGATLPAAYEEAAGITEIFRAAHIVRAWSGSAQALLDQVQADDIFHFEGHTMLVADSGDTALVLNAERGTVLEEGALRGRSRAPRLVVLAACESTGGANRSSDRMGDRGQNQLAEAFLSAGARQVIASRWPVDSAATHALMLAFYRALAEGKPAGHALMMAQETLRQSSSRFTHPYYWAGFSLITT